MKKPQVVVVGDVMRDIVVKLADAMRRGSDVNATIKSLPGGSAANQAAWIAAEGVDVALVARVGAHDVDELASAFARQGVRAYLAGDLELNTGTLVSLVEVDGERSFFTDRAANARLGADDCPPDLLDAADVLVLSGYVFFAPGGRETGLALMKSARDRELQVVIDPASVGYMMDVGVAQFLEWTAGASLLLANREEAALLANGVDLHAQLAFLLTHFDEVVIKLGAEGAIGCSRGYEPVQVPPVACRVIDTTGAGDAFAAGFLSCRLAGQTLAACLERGNLVAAKAVQYLGGRPGPSS